MTSPNPEPVEGRRPVRLQLSRRKGFRLQDLSQATNGLPAVTVARPSMRGNPWRMGEPGEFWLPQFPVSNASIGVTIGAEDAVALFRRLVNGGPDPTNRLLPTYLSAAGRIQTREWLRDHAARIRLHLHELRGNNLACWCGLDEPCHADVLLDLANRPRCEEVGR